MSQQIRRTGNIADAVNELASNNARRGLFPFGEHVGPLVGLNNIKFDRFSVFDTNSTDGTAVLPEIGKGNLGRSVAIYNSGSGIVNVVPSAGATIRGQSSEAIAAHSSSRVYVAATPTDWAGSASAGGGSGGLQFTDYKVNSGTGQVNTSSTGYVDLMSVTVTVAANTDLIMIDFSGFVRHNNVSGNSQIGIRLEINGVQHASSLLYLKMVPTDTTRRQPIASSLTILGSNCGGAGSHALTIAGNSGAGTAVEFHPRHLSALVISR